MTKVVVAAFDGLLPQQVTQDLTPTVFSLARGGVTFGRHHSVYPTVTRVNSASMVTGCYTGKHGIPANRAVFPDSDPFTTTEVLQPELDAMAVEPNTPPLLVPTIGEILAEHEMTHISVVGGTSGNAYVHFPKARSTGRGGVIHPEFSLPEHLKIGEEELLGPWPAKGVPSTGRVSRVADTACKHVIPEFDPELLFIWFPEPDGANHAYGIGSEQSNLGLTEADEALGRILKTLKQKGDEPDVFVISDHGYSTISSRVDAVEELTTAGFRTDSGERSVLVSDNGGSVLFDYPGASDDEVEKLGLWLLKQEWVGAIFTPIDAMIELGMLPVEVAMLDGRRVPQFAVSMAWVDEPARNGFRGTAWNAGNSPINAGMHGSASPYEIRNTLIAGGPSFKKATQSGIPSGNVDLAPTVLSLLGLQVPPHMDGRVLNEALTDGPDPSELVFEHYEVNGKKFQRSQADSGRAHFTAKLAELNGHRYLESAGLHQD